MKQKTNLVRRQNDYPRYNKVLRWYEPYVFERYEPVATVKRDDGTYYKRWTYVKHVTPGYWRKVKDYSNPLPPLENDWTYDVCWHYDRSVCTTPELRKQEAAEREFYDERWKIKLRAARGNLPTKYDDVNLQPPGRNWKRTHKVKKQWMKNLD